MMSDTSEFDGLLDFSKALEEYAKVSDNVLEEEEKRENQKSSQTAETVEKTESPAAETTAANTSEA